MDNCTALSISKLNIYCVDKFAHSSLWSCWFLEADKTAHAGFLKWFCSRFIQRCCERCTLALSDSIIDVHTTWHSQLSGQHTVHNMRLCHLVHSLQVCGLYTLHDFPSAGVTECSTVSEQHFISKHMDTTQSVCVTLFSKEKRNCHFALLMLWASWRS